MSSNTGPKSLSGGLCKGRAALSVGDQGRGQESGCRTNQNRVLQPGHTFESPGGAFQDPNAQATPPTPIKSGWGGGGPYFNLPDDSNTQESLRNAVSTPSCKLGSPGALLKPTGAGCILGARNQNSGGGGSGVGGCEEAARVESHKSRQRGGGIPPPPGSTGAHVSVFSW